MPLSTSEDLALDNAMLAVNQATSTLSGLIAALVADVDPHPLQVALDAMTAERDDLAARLAEVRTQLQSAQVADAAEAAADAAGDMARQAAINAAG